MATNSLASLAEQYQEFMSELEIYGATIGNASRQQDPTLSSHTTDNAENGIPEQIAQKLGEQVLQLMDENCQSEQTVIKKQLHQLMITLQEQFNDQVKIHQKQRKAQQTSLSPPSPQMSRASMFSQPDKTQHQPVNSAIKQQKSVIEQAFARGGVDLASTSQLREIHAQLSRLEAVQDQEVFDYGHGSQDRGGQFGADGTQLQSAKQMKDMTEMHLTAGNFGPETVAKCNTSLSEHNTSHEGRYRGGIRGEKSVQEMSQTASPFTGHTLTRDRPHESYSEMVPSASGHDAHQWEGHSGMVSLASGSDCNRWEGHNYSGMVPPASGSGSRHWGDRSHSRMVPPGSGHDGHHQEGHTNSKTVPVHQWEGHRQHRVNQALSPKHSTDERLYGEGHFLVRSNRPRFPDQFLGDGISKYGKPESQSFSYGSWEQQVCHISKRSMESREQNIQQDFKRLRQDRSPTWKVSPVISPNTDANRQQELPRHYDQLKQPTHEPKTVECQQFITEDLNMTRLGKNMVRCKICDIVTSTITSYQQHIRGKKHKCVVAEVKSKFQVLDYIPDTIEAKLKTETFKLEDGNELFCAICEQKFLALKGIKAHLVAMAHLKRRKQLIDFLAYKNSPGGFDNEPPMKTIWCLLCDIDIDVKKYEEHLQGKKHHTSIKRLVEEDTKDINAVSSQENTLMKDDRNIDY
ncbi:uncharacterized protein LOC144437898 [Glandiceps talaboti]